jgi:hypothetical protein
MSPFTVRRADESDDATLAWLGALASQPVPRRPALIGDIDGVPAAAISLIDGHIVRDPFRPDAGLGAHLRLHRSGWRAPDTRETLRRQLRAILPFLA